jgi:hypothetical protein
LHRAGVIGAAPDYYESRIRFGVSAQTWLLKTPANTHAVTLQRDPIFLFDANDQ